ncbi:hypothetical protein IEQ34_010006 [Dendrobium chrysotoxum]|uniref:Uncharacterized protein n=1 Tax=Dendrobium chrysotoxum TaxID=161865 RepID=A0AAV7H0A5_DENCH|nr:hypothetical protein IEQ34_010006 [Dendrobium chrysotoxum]
MDGDDQQQSKLIDELCALIFALLRSPHLFFPSASTPSRTLRPCGGAVAALYRPQQRSQFTPVGFVSLLLGASLALMLCGSVTFVLGCILMPWIIGVLMFSYFLEIISSLSEIGKAVLCLSEPAPLRTPPKEVSVSPAVLCSLLRPRKCYQTDKDSWRIPAPMWAHVLCTYNQESTNSFEVCKFVVDAKRFGRPPWSKLADAYFVVALFTGYLIRNYKTFYCNPDHIFLIFKIGE